MQHRRGPCWSERPRESPLPAERSLCLHLPWSATEFHSVDAEDRLICRACGTECLILTTYIYSHITTQELHRSRRRSGPECGTPRYMSSPLCAPSTQARPGQARAAPCIHRAAPPRPSAGGRPKLSAAALSRVFLSAFSLVPVASPIAPLPCALHTNYHTILDSHIKYIHRLRQ